MAFSRVFALAFSLFFPMLLALILFFPSLESIKGFGSLFLFVSENLLEPTCSSHTEALCCVWESCAYQKLYSQLFHNCE